MMGRKHRKEKVLPAPQKPRALKYLAGALLVGCGIGYIAATKQPAVPQIERRASLEQRVQETPQPTVQNLYQQAKTGSMSGQVYVDAIAETVPGYVQRRSAGKVKGILYDPSEEDLRRKLEPLLTSFNAKDQVEMMASELASRRAVSRFTGNEAYMTVLPRSLGTMGQSIGRYLIVRPAIFSKDAQTDDDVRSILEHELTHVDDAEEAISYLPMSMVRPDTITLDQYTDVLEVRAHYRQLALAYQERVVSGKNVLSNRYFGGVARMYKTYWDRVRAWDADPSHMMVKARLEEECAGIQATESQGKQIIRFNLFGRRDEAQFISD